MPKMKTKSAAKKRFKVTSSGKVLAPVANKRHNLRKRPQKMKRTSRGTVALTHGEEVRVKRYFLPYA
ncbi:MAG: 50S ribosomal protein L35 [Tagaea sp.]|jgi:large subunit ribosomal protein L35|nr:50S ribosomal protein L35 [Tagaea sp.]